MMSADNKRYHSSNSLAVLSAVGCLLLPLACVAQNADADCQPLVDTRVILDTVTGQFHDRSFNGLHWSDEVALVMASVRCDDTPAQVSARINALLRRLEASHTSVHAADELDYWGLNALFHFDSLDRYTLPFPGLWAVSRNNRWFASAVMDGSEAEQAGVRVGDELLRLNGQAFTPTGFVVGENRLELSSDGSEQRTLAIVAQEQSVMRAFVDASAASARLLELETAAGSRSIGYYRIWAAREQIRHNFEAWLDDLDGAGADALIVDFRGGFGGTGEEYLAPVRSLLARKPMPVHFLIDASVRSGKELLAGIVRRDGLGTLVGDTTAGYYLAGRMNRLQDERYFLYVAVDKFPTPDSGEIEGVGIAPDLHVEPCFVHCQGRDPVLEAALQAIVQQASAVQ